MKRPDYADTHSRQTSLLTAAHGAKRAMEMAVGDDYETVGRLEYCLLVQEGLRPEHTLVDVGCGSGRLAVQLKSWLSGKYIGVDIVPQLLDYARESCGRDDWTFAAAPGLTIPATDESADFVVFFSVFTHLLHEETYRYLEDSRRVLKVGGKLVFSFLEFKIPSHWAVFQSVLDDPNPEKVLNQFIDRDAIHAWASHVGLRVISINDGDKPHIALDSVVRWKDGREMHGQGQLGQSVCVLVKD